MANPKEFVDLLKRILFIDQKQCITACKALKQVLFTPTDELEASALREQIRERVQAYKLHK